MLGIPRPCREIKSGKHSTNRIMKSLVFISLFIFFSVSPKYSQTTFWRRPTLPSDPNAQIYKGNDNKQLLSEVEHDIENYQGRGLRYPPKAEKTEFNNCFIMYSKPKNKEQY